VTWVCPSVGRVGDFLEGWSWRWGWRSTNIQSHRVSSRTHRMKGSPESVYVVGRTLNYFNLLIFLFSCWMMMEDLNLDQYVSTLLPVTTRSGVSSHQSQQGTEVLTRQRRACRSHIVSWHEATLFSRYNGWYLASIRFIPFFLRAVSNSESLNQMA